VLARADDVFARLPYRRFVCDPLTPPAFEAHLVQDGYRSTSELVLLLEGEFPWPTWSAGRPDLKA
jgi:hypothetical protein